MQIIYIKNMVCPPCITAVSTILKSLNIKLTSIELGKVIIQDPLTKRNKALLQKELFNNGFELLTDQNSKIIGQIKAIIIDNIHHSKEAKKVTFSELLSAKLNKEYSSLSKLFTSIEGLTIEQFVLHQKIERVKELLFYNEFTLSEIAHQLNYSSTAHLSSQFKKVTGITPTSFKKEKIKPRKTLDSI